MKTFAEVKQWCSEATVAFGDPAVPICHLVFRWVDPDTYTGDELACGERGFRFFLWLSPNDAVPMKIALGCPEVTVDDVVDSFGVDRIAPGVWMLHPSLNIEGLIHGFVVLRDVPEPAPWERRIIVVAA